MQKALQQMNVHLHQAVSDLVGATGLRILDAIVKGERDPEALVKLRDDKLCKKTTQEELNKALQGDWQAEHSLFCGKLWRPIGTCSSRWPSAKLKWSNPWPRLSFPSSQSRKRPLRKIPKPRSHPQPSRRKSAFTRTKPGPA